MANRSDRVGSSFKSVVTGGLVLLGALGLGGPELIAQSLSCKFCDHDGIVHESSAIPVLRTGALQGMLECEGLADSLTFVTEFYSASADLLYVETGLNSADKAYFVYPSEARLVGKGGAYWVNMPIGTPGSPQLPIGDFAMRTWVAEEGTTMQLDPVTGAPYAGYAAVIDTPISVIDVGFAVYTPNPRNLLVGQVARFRILAADPVQQDEYFEIMGDDSLGVLGATQVMIPAGETYSAEFTLETDTSLVAGQIVALGSDGVEYRSAMLQTVLARTSTAFEDPAIPAIPETDTWAWCAHKAKAHAFGDGEEICGDCAVNPSSAGMCQFPNGLQRFAITGAVCGFALTTDCVFYHEVIQAFAMTGGDTYSKGCGGTTSEVNVNGEVGGTVNKGPVSGSGKVGGSYGSNTNHPLHQKCCIVQHTGQGPRTIVQCKTVE